MAASKDLTILQGRTFSLVLRWETTPIVRKAITAIDMTAGSPRITAAGHGMVDGWRCAVMGVRKPTQINADSNPPRANDFTPAMLLDADTIELNEITTTDENGTPWPDYTSGGFILYYTPVDLDGFTARMKIKDRVGGTVLLSTEAEDTGLDVIDITIDNAAKTITLTIPASATDDITWTRGVYDLEMVSGDAEPVVTMLISGKVSVTKEVTT